MSGGLVVVCDRTYAIPKERLQLTVSVVGAEGREEVVINNEGDEEAVPKKGRKRNKACVEAPSRPLTLRLQGSSVAKIECEPRNASLPAPRGSVEVAGKVDFLADDVDVTNCMVTIEASLTVGNKKMVGLTKSVMLCKYQVLITELKANRDDYQVSYEVVCVLLTYSEDDSKSAQKPLRLTLLDDSGASIPPGEGTWTVASDDKKRSTIVETDKEGQAAFTVFVSSPYMNVVGGLRLHIACDWSQDRSIFPSIPTTSRRLSLDTSDKDNSKTDDNAALERLGWNPSEDFLY